MNDNIKGEKTRKLDELFDNWKREIKKEEINRHQFISDGIVDESTWITSELKVLFLLKEPNDENSNKDWDLRELLRNGAHHRKKGYTPTWGLTARYVYGIQNGFCPWEATEQKRSGIDFRKHEQRKAYLKSIAVVNVKKSGGAGSSNWEELKKAVESSHSFIKEEIRIIAPDLIITGGTEKLISKIFTELHSRKKKSLSTGVKYWKPRNENYFIIEYYHPQARFPHHLMYTVLMESLKELFRDKITSNSTK